MRSPRVRFELEAFRRFDPGGDHALVHVTGSWVSRRPLMLAYCELLVDDGKTVRRFRPLPPTAATPMGPEPTVWHAGYSVPTRILDGPEELRIALQTSFGLMLFLPQPVAEDEPPRPGALVTPEPRATPRPRTTAPDAFLALGASVVVGGVSLAAFGIATVRPDLLPVLLVTLLLGLFLFSRPQWVLPTFIGVTWASLPGGLFGGFPSPVEFGGLALLALAAWYAVGRLALAREVLIIVTLLALPLVASGLLSSEGLTVPSDQLKDLSFLFIAALCARSFADVDRVTVVLALTAIFLGLGAVHSVLVEPTALFPLSVEPEEYVDREAPRAGGPFGEPNFFAMSLAALTPLALYLIPQGRYRRVIGLLALVAIAGGVLSAGSRGGLLATGFALIAFSLVTPDRRIRVGAVAAIVAGLALLPLFAGQTESFSKRTVSGRATENLIAVAMFEDYPLSGVGPGLYPTHYRDYSRHIGNDPRPRRSAHSLPLEIMAEQGIVGLIGWTLAGLIMLSYVLARGVWQRALGKALLLSIATFMVSSLFLHGSQVRLLYLLVGLVLALAASLPRHERRVFAS